MSASAAPAPAVVAAHQRRDRREVLAAMALAGPAGALILLFLIGPLICIALLSLTDYQLGAKTMRLVGLTNYVEMFGDRVFRRSLENTLIYVAVVVPLSVGLGLAAALLIEAGTSLRAFYRTVYFLPVMATLIAMAIVWEFALHPTLGPVNVMLQAIGFSRVDWLQDRNVVLYTLAGIGIWQSVGFNMVLFMAGLQSIPKDLYEAASVDGVSNGWDRFRTVTWPMLGPVSLFVIVITAIRSFQVFDTVQVMTKGGPNRASEVLLYTMYSEGFEFFRTGYAAAVTMVFLAFVLTIAVLKTWLLDRRVHYA